MATRHILLALLVFLSGHRAEDIVEETNDIDFDNEDPSKNDSEEELDDNDDEEDDDDEDDDDAINPMMQWDIVNAPASTCDLCQKSFSAVGCYARRHCRHGNQLNKLLFEIDKCHRKMDNVTFDKHVKGLACRCATEARKRGYKYFGLQDYRQCWGGKPKGGLFKKVGARKGCYNNLKKKCNSTADRYCVGRRFTNYVYSLDSVKEQAVKYSKVGCYGDRMAARALPLQLDNHRDIHSNVFHGEIINWKKFKAAVESLLKDCAAKTKAKGYTYFGLQYFGECWSGPEGASTFNKYGPSAACVNTAFKSCHADKDCVCIGKHETNFVYKVDA